MVLVDHGILWSPTMVNCIFTTRTRAQTKLPTIHWFHFPSAWRQRKQLDKFLISRQSTIKTVIIFQLLCASVIWNLGPRQQIFGISKRIKGDCFMVAWTENQFVTNSTNAWSTRTVCSSPKQIVVPPIDSVLNRFHRGQVRKQPRTRQRHFQTIQFCNQHASLFQGKTSWHMKNPIFAPAIPRSSTHQPSHESLQSTN